jgi:hypothetical protein
MFGDNQNDSRIASSGNVPEGEKPCLTLNVPDSWTIVPL